MPLRIDVRWEWSGAIVSDGGQSVQVFTMLLGPALTDLTEAVIRLLRGIEHTTAFWEDDPGQYRWVFDRDGERVRVQILHFARAFTRVDNEHGTRVFDAVCRLAVLAGQVVSELERLQADHPPCIEPSPGGRKYVPVAAHHVLGQLIRQRKQGRRTLGHPGAA
jgi:hypothetical protein